jgi:pimeloyl-ACP methyl ester carboxylesterase
MPPRCRAGRENGLESAPPEHDPAPERSGTTLKTPIRRIVRGAHYNKLPKGTHFAAWEQPDLFVAEMRAAFKSLRKPS